MTRPQAINAPACDPCATGCAAPCCPHCSTPLLMYFDRRERVEEAVCPQCGWKYHDAECASGQWQHQEPGKPEPEANEIDKAAQEKAARDLLAHLGAPRLRCVCAWCGSLIRDGAQPTSHGICLDCYDRMGEQAHDNAQAEQAWQDHLDGKDEMVNLADLADDVDPPPF
jgi:hypothetical protein